MTPPPPHPATFSADSKSVARNIEVIEVSLVLEFFNTL